MKRIKENILQIVITIWFRNFILEVQITQKTQIMFLFSTNKSADQESQLQLRNLLFSNTL